MKKMFNIFLVVEARNGAKHATGLGTASHVNYQAPDVNGAKLRNSGTLLHGPVPSVAGSKSDCKNTKPPKTPFW